MPRTLLALLLLASSLVAQVYTPPGGGSGSAFVGIGLLASIPATCTVGQLYFATNATAGQQIYECSSTNTWTQQLNNGGSGVSFSALTPGTNANSGAYALSSGSTFTIGTTSLAAISATGGTWLTSTIPTVTSPAFYEQVFGPQTQTGCTPNVVRRYGWNVGQGGGLVDGTYGAIATEYEGHYCASPGVPSEEYHIVGYPLSGGAVRAFSLQFYEGTSVMDVSQTFDSLSIKRRSDAIQLAKWTASSSTLDLFQSFAIRNNTNNFDGLTQINAAGNAYISIAKINASNQVLVDSGGVGTVFGGLLTTNNDIVSNANITAASGTIAGALVTGVNNRAGTFRVDVGGQYETNGRSKLYSPSDGDWIVWNSAQNNFTSLKLGGATSSFPELKRSGTAVAFRLADDSGDAPITSSTITMSGSTFSLGGHTCSIVSTVVTCP